MQDRTKKLIAAAFGTVSALVMLAMAVPDLVPAHYHKLLVFLVGALNLVGTMFLPALIGQAVPVAQSLADSAAKVAKVGAMLPLAFGALCLGGCSSPAAPWGMIAILCAALVALRVAGAARGLALALLLAPSAAHADAAIPVHLEPARALPAMMQAPSVLAIEQAADKAIQAAQTVAAPAPAPDKAKEAAAVLAGLGAGLQTGVQGVQALGKSNAAVGSWLESKGGVIFMGCLGGAIVVISAVGSFALAYDVTKPAATSAVQPAGLTVARW